MFTINIELLTAQESTASELTDQESDADDQHTTTATTDPSDSGVAEDDLGGDNGDDPSVDIPTPLPPPIDIPTPLPPPIDIPTPQQPLNGDGGTAPPPEPDPVDIPTPQQPLNGDGGTAPPPQPDPVDIPTPQQPLNGDGGTAPPPQPQNGGIHQSITDGFQLQVPAKWVVEDIDNTNINAQMSEEQSGYTYLARICPLDNALIVSVGRYQCGKGSAANVNIMRFNDLYQRPEFASLGNRDITTSDFLSYYIQFWQRTAGISDVRIWNNIDTAVNVTSAQTNQIVATMPAKLIEYTYLYSPDGGSTMTQGREFTLLVLNGGTGYSLFYEGLASSLASGVPPFQVDQMFDSFRLVTATPAG
jgi:hypothetical protein